MIAETEGVCVCAREGSVGRLRSKVGKRVDNGEGAVR